MLSGDAANTIFIVIDLTRPEINTRSTILEVSMLTIIDAVTFWWITTYNIDEIKKCVQHNMYRKFEKNVSFTNQSNYNKINDFHIVLHE